MNAQIIFLVLKEGTLTEHSVSRDVGVSPICRFVENEFVHRAGWDSTPRQHAPWGLEIYEPNY
jgi:hypothetical protein